MSYSGPHDARFTQDMITERKAPLWKKDDFQWRIILGLK